MPTPTKKFRVDDAVWDAAVRRAEAEGRSGVSEVLVARLVEYGAGAPDPQLVAAAEQAAAARAADASTSRRADA